MAKRLTPEEYADRINVHHEEHGEEESARELVQRWTDFKLSSDAKGAA